MTVTVTGPIHPNIGECKIVHSCSPLLYPGGGSDGSGDNGGSGGGGDDACH